MNQTTDEYEEAFSEFLDSHEYDNASEYLFQTARAAFRSGWQSAARFYAEKWSRLKVLPDENEVPEA